MTFRTAVVLLPLALLSCPTISHAQDARARQARETLRPFDFDQDILLAQLDSRPEGDDIYSQAALGMACCSTRISTI